MPGRPTSRSIRVVVGEIDSRSVTTRLVLPTPSQPVWPPFLRVAESIATQGRTLPAHAHEREEVLTYVTEGFAVYQLGRDPPEALSQGAARLLTTGARIEHRVSPARGGAIRWFNLVVGLPAPEARAPRLQSAAANSPTIEVDTVRVRSLVGPRAPMTSAIGLECEELVFVEPSTTIPRVGPRRRGMLYALAGRGTVDDQPVDAGEAVLVEGMPGIAVHGGVGFRAMLATAPAEPLAPTSTAEPRSAQLRPSAADSIRRARDPDSHAERDRVRSLFAVAHSQLEPDRALHRIQVARELREQPIADRLPPATVVRVERAPSAALLLLDQRERGACVPRRELRRVEHVGEQDRGEPPTARYDDTNRARTKALAPADDQAVGRPR